MEVMVQIRHARTRQVWLQKILKDKDDYLSWIFPLTKRKKREISPFGSQMYIEFDGNHHHMTNEFIIIIIVIAITN